MCVARLTGKVLHDAGPGHPLIHNTDGEKNYWPPVLSGQSDSSTRPIQICRAVHGSSLSFPMSIKHTKEASIDSHAEATASDALVLSLCQYSVLSPKSSQKVCITFSAKLRFFGYVEPRVTGHPLIRVRASVARSPHSVLPVRVLSINSTYVGHRSNHLTKFYAVTRSCDEVRSRLFLKATSPLNSEA